MLWIAIACRVDVAPLVDARGGGGGYWPRHSASAVRGAIGAGFDGLEVDITPTEDGEWLLQGGLHWQGCIDVRSQLPPDPPAVRDWVLDTAQSHLRCGATPDPQRPNALLVPEAPWSLQQLAMAIRSGGHAEQRIHLHLRISELEPLLVRDVLEIWHLADLPNQLVVSTDEIATLVEVERSSRTLNIEVSTSLRLADEEDDELVSTVDDALWNELESVRASAIAVPVAAWNRRQLREAHHHGLQVWVLDPGHPYDWPAGAEVVLTDFPGDLP